MTYSPRACRTEAGSKVIFMPDERTIAFVEFDWLEEGGCIECEPDLDAIRHANLTKLIWTCPECGGGSADLENYTR